MQGNILLKWSLSLHLFYQIMSYYILDDAMVRKEEGEMKRENTVWGDELYASNLILLTMSGDIANNNRFPWAFEHFKS